MCNEDYRPELDEHGQVKAELLSERRALAEATRGGPVARRASLNREGVHNMVLSAIEAA